MPITTTTPKAMTLGLGCGDVGISTIALESGVAVILEPLGEPANLGAEVGPQLDGGSLDVICKAVPEGSVVIHADGLSGAFGLDILIAKLEQARRDLCPLVPRIRLSQLEHHANFRRELAASQQDPIRCT